MKSLVSNVVEDKNIESARCLICLQLCTKFFSNVKSVIDSHTNHINLASTNSIQIKNKKNHRREAKFSETQFLHLNVMYKGVCNLRWNFVLVYGAIFTNVA